MEIRNPTTRPRDLVTQRTNNINMRPHANTLATTVAVATLLLCVYTATTSCFIADDLPRDARSVNSAFPDEWQNCTHGLNKHNVSKQGLACQNGRCLDNETCFCQAGWGGEACMFPMCPHGTASNFTDSYSYKHAHWTKCDCEDGWNGPNCLVCDKDTACLAASEEYGAPQYTGCKTNMKAENDIFFTCNITDQEFLIFLNNEGFMTMQCYNVTVGSGESGGWCSATIYSADQEDPPNIISVFIVKMYNCSGTTNGTSVSYECTTSQAGCTVGGANSICAPDLWQVIGLIETTTTMVCNLDSEGAVDGGSSTSVLNNCFLDQVDLQMNIGVACTAGECV